MSRRPLAESDSPTDGTAPDGNKLCLTRPVAGARKATLHRPPATNRRHVRIAPGLATFRLPAGPPLLVLRSVDSCCLHTHGASQDRSFAPFYLHLCSRPRHGCRARRQAQDRTSSGNQSATVRYPLLLPEARTAGKTCKLRKVEYVCKLPFCLLPFSSTVPHPLV